MGTSIDSLISFVNRRREQLGIGQNALARACGLQPGTLSNLLRGRVTRAPSLATLEKLSYGLSVDVEMLVRIARGELVEQLAQTRGRPRKGTLQELLERPVAGRYPLTDEEWRVIRAAERLGLKWHLDQHPRILDVPPGQRTWIFRGLESLAHHIVVIERTAEPPEPPPT